MDHPKLDVFLSFLEKKNMKRKEKTYNEQTRKIFRNRFARRGTSYLLVVTYIMNKLKVL